MIELDTVANALVFLAILGAVAKIHGQVNELRGALTTISTTLHAGTLSLKKQLEKIEGEIDLLFNEIKRPRPKDVQWIG